MEQRLAKGGQRSILFLSLIIFRHCSSKAGITYKADVLIRVIKRRSEPYRLKGCILFVIAGQVDIIAQLSLTAMPRIPTLLFSTAYFNVNFDS